MDAPDGRAVYQRFMAAVISRDIEALDALVHPDFQEIYPQSGERTIGAANLKGLLSMEPPGIEDLGGRRVVSAEDRWMLAPTFTLVQVAGSGNVFTGVQRARYPDGSEWWVVQIATLRDGRVWRVESYWAPAFEPAPWRAPFVTVEPTA